MARPAGLEPAASGFEAESTQYMTEVDPSGQPGTSADTRSGFAAPGGAADVTGADTRGQDCAAVRHKSGTNSAQPIAAVSLGIRPAGRQTPWGSLLLAPAEAAQYVGVAEAELVALHERGVLPGVLFGDGVRFRRGDLARLPSRLVAKSRRRRR